MYLVVLDCDFEPFSISYPYSTKEGAWKNAKNLIQRKINRGVFPSNGVSIYYYGIDCDKKSNLLWKYRFNKAEL